MIDPIIVNAADSFLQLFFNNTRTEINGACYFCQREKKKTRRVERQVYRGRILPTCTVCHSVFKHLCSAQFKASKYTDSDMLLARNFEDVPEWLFAKFVAQRVIHLSSYPTEEMLNARQ